MSLVFQQIIFLMQSQKVPFLPEDLRENMKSNYYVADNRDVLRQEESAINPRRTNDSKRR